MRNSITENIFENAGKKGSVSILYWISLVLCVSVLLFSVGVFIFLDRSKESKESIIPQFEAALNDGRYDDALSMYREIHDSDDPMKNDERQELMTKMENLVYEKAITIENKIRYERYSLKTDDLKFLNGMGEITYSHLSNWLNFLCEEFLLGNIEKPDITFIFDEITVVDNISAVASPLLREVDSIEMARGVVQSAEDKFSEGDYISSVQLYTSVLDDSEGFVHNFADKRVAEIKEIMYLPMLDECEHMLDRYQYYSAETILSSLAVIFPDDTRIANDLIMATEKTSPVVDYYGSVEVICVRQLIADTELAFGEDYSPSNDELYLTTTEFSNMLNELYAKNYVLVDAEALVDLSNEEYLVETNLRVPEGKKPLIIVIENLDYSMRNYGNGTCEKLVINEQGQVCGEYVNSAGQEVVTRSSEAIGILDMFIEEHPDFSFNGVKGVISICGYESCFGYVISEDEVDDHNLALNAIGRPSEDITSQDIEANKNTVSSIVKILKDTGWKFASSTYGNINAADSSMEEIVSDFDKWNEQIGSVLGTTHMIVYPNGNFINGTDPRAEHLKSLGFRIFFGIGPNPYYTYGINYLYYDRTLVNGSTMRNADLSRLFDVSAVYDDSRVKKLE
ncbi:MAG: hypothetical protein J6U54_14770 [Clostridiales bacterium]|nr:hypothetical protein [Clostridiales bacterium]